MSDTTDPDTPLADEVIQLLVAMSARLSHHFAAHAAAFGLSAPEGKVLLALEPDRAQSMREIARRLDYDASNLTGVVDKLERQDVVERTTDSSDRRVKAIAATEHGRHLGQRLSAELRADVGPVRALSDSQLRELRGLLQHAMADDTDR